MYPLASGYSVLSMGQFNISWHSECVRCWPNREDSGSAVWFLVSFCSEGVTSVWKNGGNKMSVKKSEKKKYIPVENKLVQVTEIIYNEYYKPIWRERKHAQALGECRCPKSQLWNCDGICPGCRYYASGDQLSKKQTVKTVSRLAIFCLIRYVQLLKSLKNLSWYLPCTMPWINLLQRKKQSASTWWQVKASAKLQNCSPWVRAL